MIILFTLSNEIIQFIIWVMPQKFKLYFNRNYCSFAIKAIHGVDSDLKMEKRDHSNLEIINFLGEKFSSIVIMPLIQCNGLIEGAYYNYLDEIGLQDKKNASLLSYKTWDHILNTTFKTLLNKTSLLHQYSILKELKEELRNQQSLVSLVF